MTATHDFEEILDKILSILKESFNDKLSEIETDKGDGLSLPTVDPNAYFLQSMNDDAANYDPIIFYGLENVETENQGPHTSEKLFISVVILLSDNGRGDINKIMFRYSKALKEVFEENWQIAQSSARINVNRSTVVPFESLNGAETFKAVGVELEVNLA